MTERRATASLRRAVLATVAACVAWPPLRAQNMGEEARRSLIVVHTWADGTVLRAGPLDTASAARLTPSLQQGRGAVEAFFGSAFRQAFTVTLVSNRAAFSDVLKAEWGVPETACWMIATGVADFLVLLSPRVWSQEACEHDPADSQHVTDIVIHELVHVYHGQRHPSRDFDFEAADEMGWFIEGLATYVSGQLDRRRLATAQEALASGALPTRLRDAWSGRFRYGVSGSMVQFIDQRFGRRALIDLLPLTSNAALLDALHLSEADFVATWTAWLRTR